MRPLLPELQVEARFHRLVVVDDFVDLVLEDAREDEASIGGDPGDELGGKHLERIGEDVRNHYCIALARQGVGQEEAGFGFVRFGVVRGRLDRERVDVGALDAPGAEELGGDGEDAGAAAVVEDGVLGADVPVEPLQAQVRGRMAA